MPIAWTCCHCGHVTRLPDAMDGLQGRCQKCRRYNMIQGPYISDEEAAAGEGSNNHLRIAPESDIDRPTGDDEANFPLRDFQ
jgi:predicted ATP-dependent serine protease